MTWKKDVPLITRGKWDALLRSFVNSGEDCWSKDFESASVAADRARSIRNAAARIGAGVHVTKVGSKVFLVREEIW